MARPNKIAEIARQRGIPEYRLVLPLVNRGGQKLAAEKLGVSQATISAWLKDNGYVESTTWGKATTPSEHADIEAAHDRVNAARELAGQPSIEQEVESW